MLPLWKPILKLKNKNNPVIFNELTFKYSEWDKIKNKTVISTDEHPFVIFYDENENCYYYLKARSAFRFNKVKNEYIQKRKNNDFEILITESLDDGLFRKKSYVDCSQIFKCNKDLLESLIDIDCDDFKNTNKLDNNVIKILLETLNKAIFEVPPNISLMEVKMNKNGETYGESLYLSEQKIYEINCEIMNNPNLDGDEIDWLSFESKKDNAFLTTKNRYWNGINFCKLFLNEYYPSLVNEFEQVQGIKGVTFKYTPPKLDNIYNNDDEQDDEIENNSFWPFR